MLTLPAVLLVSSGALASRPKSSSFIGDLLATFEIHDDQFREWATVSETVRQTGHLWMPSAGSGQPEGSS